MIKEPSNKDKELKCVISNLKACLRKLDSIKETNPYELIGIAIPGDKDVINSIYSVIKTAIGFKQSELDNQDFRVPAGSDYDLDKVKVQQTVASTGTSFGDICVSMIELHDKKNADYGDAFTKSMGIFGSTYLLSRLHDKLQRLINISLGAQVRVTDETYLDTLMDLACYAVMGIEYYQNIDKL